MPVSHRSSGCSIFVTRSSPDDAKSFEENLGSGLNMLLHCVLRPSIRNARGESVEDDASASDELYALLQSGHGRSGHVFEQRGADMRGDTSW